MESARRGECNLDAFITKMAVILQQRAVEPERSFLACVAKSLPWISARCVSYLHVVAGVFLCWTAASISSADKAGKKAPCPAVWRPLSAGFTHANNSSSQDCVVTHPQRTSPAARAMQGPLLGVIIHQLFSSSLYPKFVACEYCLFSPRTLNSRLPGTFCPCFDIVAAYKMTAECFWEHFVGTEKSYFSY